MPAPLTEPWQLGPLRVPNRVMLAPLAGIGNWFVRLQAKRYGAGMAVSEMVSSHAIFHGNERTCTEMLRIDPREREVDGQRGGIGLNGHPVDGQRGGIGLSGHLVDGRRVGIDSRGQPVESRRAGIGPRERQFEGRRGGGDERSFQADHARARVGARGIVSIQLFGQEPEIMRAAAREVARAGADAIDLNMGCPVPKVCKTGSGAALLDEPDTAVAVVRAACAGSGLPVTVKLRSGRRPGEESGFALAHRLVREAGVAAIAFHPRSAAVHHKGVPDYELAARLVRTLDAPVILTGGLHDAPATLAAYEQTGAAAVMLARGSLGNPWLFAQLLGLREQQEGPSRAEVFSELRWTIDRAIEHLGAPRAVRYLRKFYPWYVARLALAKPYAKGLSESLQSADSLEQVASLLAGERQSSDRRDRRAKR